MSYINVTDEKNHIFPDWKMANRNFILLATNYMNTQVVENYSDGYNVQIFEFERLRNFDPPSKYAKEFNRILNDFIKEYTDRMDIPAIAKEYEGRQMNEITRLELCLEIATKKAQINHKDYPNTMEQVLLQRLGVPQGYISEFLEYQKEEDK